MVLSDRLYFRSCRNKAALRAASRDAAILLARRCSTARDSHRCRAGQIRRRCRRKGEREALSSPWDPLLDLPWGRRR